MGEFVCLSRLLLQDTKYSAKQKIIATLRVEFKTIPIKVLAEITRASYSTIRRVLSNPQLLQLAGDLSKGYIPLKSCLLCADLGANRLLIVSLLKHFDTCYGNSFPSEKTMGIRLGMSRKTIQRAKSKLSKAGILSWGYTPSKVSNKQVCTYRCVINVSKLTHNSVQIDPQHCKFCPTIVFKLTHYLTIFNYIKLYLDSKPISLPLKTTLLNCPFMDKDSLSALNSLLEEIPVKTKDDISKSYITKAKKKALKNTRVTDMEIGRAHV